MISHTAGSVRADEKSMTARIVLPVQMSWQPW